MNIDVNKAALSLGVLFGVLHFVGVLLITLSGGSYVELSMAMHHIKGAFTYLPLDAVNLVIGTIVAAVIGGIIGGLFAVIWNQFEGRK